MALTSAPATAHHSFSATFQQDAKITVEGVVTKYTFRNPHILIGFDVTNEDGSTSPWVVEGSAATLMRRAGWTADTFNIGDLIRVAGDSTHDGSPMIGMDTIDVLDPNTKAVLASHGDRNKLAATGQGLAANQPAEEPSYTPYDAPKTRSDGTPNLSLAWAGDLPAQGRPQRPQLTLTPAGEKVQAAFILANDPQVFCDPAGLARTAGTPHPFKITQMDETVEIEYEEYGSVRIVPLGEKGDKPVNSGAKSHFGDSIAYYDGDSLVIETINLLENQATPFGNAVSDQASTIERMSRVDDGEHGAMIKVEMIVTDPLYFADSFSIKKVKTAVEGYKMLENGCEAPLRLRGAASVSTSFFLTSEGLGDGANLGGLAGADAHCEALASAVNVGGRGWRAYLSTTGETSVNAIDRIGTGPWHNSRGVLIANDKADLIAATGLTKTSMISERSLIISGRGDEVNRHDILTGTQNDGTALNNGEDTNCSNWTSNGDGSALAGHHDRIGGGADPTSWTYAHGTRGCSQSDLEGTGGAGLFYCFASIPSSSENRLDTLVPAPPGAGATFPGRGGPPGVRGRNGPPEGIGAPQAPKANSEGGGFSWLWGLLGALVLGGIGFMAIRKTD